jgi:hypothetical protein
VVRADRFHVTSTDRFDAGSVPGFCELAAIGLASDSGVPHRLCSPPDDRARCGSDESDGSCAPVFVALETPFAETLFNLVGWLAVLVALVATVRATRRPSIPAR